MIFMGEETYAQTPFPFFVSHTDERLLRLTNEGRAHEFARYGWDLDAVPEPADPATFDSAKLNWDFGDDSAQMLSAYKKLLSLRKDFNLARDDLRELQVEHGAGWLTMGYDDVVLAANFSGEPVTVPVGGELVYSFTQPKTTNTSTVLDPWGFVVISR